MGVIVYIQSKNWEILKQYGMDNEGFGVNKAVEQMAKSINEYDNIDEDCHRYPQ